VPCRNSFICNELALPVRYYSSLSLPLLPVRNKTAQTPLPCLHVSRPVLVPRVLRHPGAEGTRSYSFTARGHETRSSPQPQLPRALHTAPFAKGGWGIFQYPLSLALLLKPHFLKPQAFSSSDVFPPVFHPIYRALTKPLLNLITPCLSNSCVSNYTITDWVRLVILHVCINALPHPARTLQSLSKGAPQ